MKHNFRLCSILTVILTLAMILTALPQSVFAMDTSDIDQAIPIELDTYYKFTAEDEKLILSFIPEETQEYKLYYDEDSYGCDPHVELYDADLNYLTGCNLYEHYVTGLNYELEADKLYYYEITNLRDTDDFSAWFALTIETVQTVTFHANGGYFYGGGESLLRGYTKGTPITSTYCGEYDEDRQVFNDNPKLVFWGWATSENASKPDIILDETLVDGITDLWAVWTEGVIVTFHSTNENVWFIDEEGNHTDEKQMAFAPGILYSWADYPYSYSSASEGSYYLDKYYWDPEMQNPVDEDIEITESTEPFDLWCSFYLGVEISFDANGGSFAFDYDGKYWENSDYINHFRVGDTVDLLEYFNEKDFNLRPPMNGMVLAGWSFDPDGRDVFQTLTITTDLHYQRLYAVWEGGVHITLHANLDGAYYIDDYGNQVSELNITVEDGTYLSRVIYNYDLYSPDEDRWSFESNYSLSPGGEPLPFATVLTDGMELYAIWQEMVWITYDAGDGTVNMNGEQIYKKSVEKGSWVSFKHTDVAKPNRDDMAFLWWSIDGTREGIIKDLYKVDESITLYALYSKGNHITIIANNADYGRFIVRESGSSVYGSEITFLLAEGKSLADAYVTPYSMSELGSFVFSGWSESVDGEILDDSYVPDHDMTLYGIFIRGHSVYFQANGGTFDESLRTPITLKRVNVPEGEVIGEVPVWHESKYFAEWNTESDGSGKTIDPTTYIPYSNSETYNTFYAIWSDEPVNDPITITLYPTEATLEEGDTLQLEVMKSPESDVSIIWSSSDEKIASVDENGKVKAITPGTAVITASAADGNGTTASCTVTVLKHQHVWDAGVVTKAATCTEAGVKTFTCERCGETKNEEIPALGHDWDDGTVTKEATVEEEGEMTYTCRRCGETKTEVIPKLDSISVTAVTVDPSEEEMATSQTIKEKPYTITKASTLQLTAKIEPENATNKNVTWTSSNPAVATVDENGVVTALTYGKTTITVTTEDGGKTASCQIQTRYNDVADSGRYWFNPVYWAADNNITKGYANIYFGPEENCTREQMITFLYRTAGSPAVSGSVSFSDVKKGAYYYNAVLWAYNNGITKGYSSGPNKGKFGVGLNVTREDTVTFIYRMAGKPKYSTTKSFSDVKKGKYYYDPVRWAAQNNITKGYADGTFGVGKDVLRKDIVTFLYRYANLK